MYSLNRAQIIGNVTRDPEMRYIPSGQAVVSFGIATNRRWRDKDGNNQEQTEFHDVVAWGKLAEIMSQILHKGNKVYVEGRLQTRSWEGQDGAKRQRTEIVVDDFVALSPKGDFGGSSAVDAGPDAEEFPIKSDEGIKDKPAKKAPTSDESESRPGSVGKEPAEDEINLDEIPF